MRISDWSSDVCSSDLKLAGRVSGTDVESAGDRVLAKVHALRAGQYLCRFDIDHATADPVAVTEINAVDEQARLLFEPRLQATIADTANIDPVGQNIGRDVDVGIGGGGGMHRTNNLTSELSSKQRSDRRRRTHPPRYGKR